MDGASPSLLRQTLDRIRGVVIERRLDRYRERVQAVTALESELATCSPSELSARAAGLGRELRAGGDPDRPVDQAFALVREASRRRLGLRPTDEQLIAGLAMHAGKIAEMETGEGKTLAAVAPAALTALNGSRVHVVTANDYLARRDAAWMEPVYGALGLEVAAVQEGMSRPARRAAYAADVVYLTAKEAGFDLLRDLLCLEPEDRVRRPAELVLVDEADSILIDEARIPLVIAGELEPTASAAESMARLVRELRAGVDFDTDELARNIFLTDAGCARVEGLLGLEDLYSDAQVDLLADLRHALHAQHLLVRDVDYIVRGGRIELVDELTGRVADRRRWPDGLQAAIEAKEGLRLRRTGRILGSITMQHVVLSYPRIAGMTATAVSAAEELATFYGLGVVVVPTHRPCVRIDRPDRVFARRDAKLAALVDEIRDCHRRRRPVLVGTGSVAESEELAASLAAGGIDCQVLNARNDQAEAEIVARAGSLGAVTISTNMAGRGTDIRLGGPDESEREAVVALGGLYVIGTNRHESIRIDRQLRGRAGRQGDPGESRLFVSLEDPLLRRCGADALSELIRPDERRGEGSDSGLLRREIARAQRIVEGENLDIRRRLWDYSQLVEGQRLDLMAWREAVLESRSHGGILADRRPERWARLERSLPDSVLSGVERRLTLLAIDRCWSDHLAEVRRIRDGIHVVKVVGRDPLAEFTREIGAASAALEDAIEDELVATFDRIEVGPDGVDWAREGLLGPSSTWTYLVSDEPFGANPLQSLANRAGLALWGAILLGPLIFLWGLLLHWRRRSGLRREPDRPLPEADGPEALAAHEPASAGGGGVGTRPLSYD